MEDNMISKKLAVFSVLLATIITGVGVAFGYFIWNSTTNTDISFTVEGAVVQLDDGTDITGANLMPVASYTSGGKNVVKKDIKIKLKDTTSDTVTVDFKLKVNSIDSGLNHSSFMYNLVNASGTSVKSGNFSTSKAGDTISLLTLSTSDGSLTTSLSTYTLYIYINGVSGDNPSSMQNQKFDMSFIVEGANSSRGYISNGELLVTKVEGLDDGTTGDSGSGVYKIHHDAISASSSATGSDIPEVTDYRYYGANPNNYICLDNEGQSTCPDRSLYRIIGSIYEENAKTNLIKVIKATSVSNGLDYDTSSGNIWATPTNGRFSNSTTSGSSLMKFLNNDFLNISNSYSLSKIAQEYINKSLFYLGGVFGNDDLNTSYMYVFERGVSEVANTYSFSWEGKVGLMYPSDYGYAAGNNCATDTSLISYNEGCKSKDWLYNINIDIDEAEWFMTPYFDEAGGVFYLGLEGDLGGTSGTNEIHSARPTFYLKSSVSITSGTGTQDDPYLVS